MNGATEENRLKTKDIHPRKGEIVKPHELIGVAGQESWTLAERRAWNTLLVNAWGDDLDKPGAMFSMELKDLRGLHDSNDRIRPSLRRFQQTLITAKLPDGKTRTVQLLGATDMDEEEREDGILVYDFHPKLIELLRDSELYARMQMKVIAAFTSKYALSLYEVVASKVNMRRQFEELDLDTLRQWLGVEMGKLTTWSNLRKFAIEPALKEVNGLSPFAVEIDPIKRGRKVISVRVSWAKKDPFSPSEKAAAQEVNRSKLGRKSRISGNTEHITPAPLRLSDNDIQKGWNAAADICRIDKHAAYRDWQGIVAALPEQPKNPVGHFIQFCKKRAQEVR